VIPVSNLSKIKIATRLPIRADYIIHALMFFPWAFFMFAFKKINKWIWIFIGLLVGIIMEFVQHFLKYRTFSFNDIIADGVGLILGLITSLMIYYIVYKIKKKKQTKIS
jgi:VanZ family protein